MSERVAYADPPYPGQAAKHYSHDPRCAEVDHRLLIEHLETYDRWALSTSSVALRDVLPLCPPDVRVCSWVKPFCSYKPNVGVAYAWEPVIVKNPRKRSRKEPTIRDFVIANITLRRGLSGAKPEQFCFWLFEILGVNETTQFFDLYPGTNAVTESLRKYLRQFSIFLTANRERGEVNNVEGFDLRPGERKDSGSE